MNYNTYALPNGLRIIHRHADTPVVYCGYAIATGARHEHNDQYGLAHFCEHMTFKGTERLSSLQVINTLERVGGDLNAFTTKQDTFYYATVLRKDFPRAVRLLTDIVFRSTYPQTEIDKEVEVICDEIESYNDSPADLIYDEFENIIFESTPLGHNILGTSERVRSFNTADALAFTRTNYTPANAVFYVLGNISFPQLIKSLTSLLPSHPLSSSFHSPHTPSGVPFFAARQQSSISPISSPNPFPQSPTPPAPIIKSIDSHQAHVIIGTAIPKPQTEDPEGTTPLSPALFLLNNILGGPSMNSRFNLALREKRGLVYSVDSTITTYSDTYLWTTYLGCDPEDVNRCLRLIHSEISRLQRAPLSPTSLRRAKQQLKGQLTLAAENRENFAIDMAKQYLHRHTLKSNDDLFQRIEAVSADHILYIAQHYLAPSSLTTLIMK